MINPKPFYFNFFPSFFFFFFFFQFNPAVLTAMKNQVFIKQYFLVVYLFIFFCFLEIFFFLEFIIQ